MNRTSTSDSNTSRPAASSTPAPISADLNRVPSGLSVNALKTLYYIHLDTRSMSRLSEKLSVTRAAMTGVIDAMEKLGLAHRCAHPDDRRRTIVKLTPAGERLAEQVFETKRRAEARAKC